MAPSVCDLFSVIFLSKKVYLSVAIGVARVIYSFIKSIISLFLNYLVAIHKYSTLVKLSRLLEIILDKYFVKTF